MKDTGITLARKQHLVANQPAPLPAISARCAAVIVGYLVGRYERRGLAISGALTHRAFNLPSLRQWSIWRAS
jgi:hypothetical protein